MWTALIPLKGNGKRKTRLGGRLSVDQRGRLTANMFDHLVSVLKTCSNIGEIVLLSDEIPEDWTGPFILDKGLGLNAELRRSAAVLTPRPLLVVHADLPLVTALDVQVLLATADRGCALAPDRHESGTNAVATRHGDGFNFHFGPDSFQRHLVMNQNRVGVVRRPGLALDIDTPADLDAAIGISCGLADWLESSPATADNAASRRPETHTLAHALGRG